MAGVQSAFTARRDDRRGIFFGCGRSTSVNILVSWPLSPAGRVPMHECACVCGTGVGIVGASGPGAGGTSLTSFPTKASILSCNLDSSCSRGSSPHLWWRPPLGSPPALAAPAVARPASPGAPWLLQAKRLPRVSLCPRGCRVRRLSQAGAVEERVSGTVRLRRRLLPTGKPARRLAACSRVRRPPRAGAASERARRTARSCRCRRPAVRPERGTGVASWQEAHKRHRLGRPLGEAVARASGLPVPVGGALRLGSCHQEEANRAWGLPAASCCRLPRRPRPREVGAVSAAHWPHLQGARVHFRSATPTYRQARAPAAAAATAPDSGATPRCNPPSSHCRHSSEPLC